MNIKIWKRLNDNLHEMDDLYGGSCSDEEINEAEKVLGARFSDQYRYFLKAYGGAKIESFIVNGLKHTSMMGTFAWSVIDKTNFFKHKQRWPGIDDWYVVSDDGRGNPIGINPAGEVWMSDHDDGFRQFKLADDFEQFIEKILDDTLFE